MVILKFYKYYILLNKNILLLKYHISLIKYFKFFKFHFLVNFFYNKKKI
jgi:hypothetical protein